MRRLLLPSTVLAAAFAADLWIGPEFLSQGSWPAVQRTMLAAVLLLAWRLRRGRIAWACLPLAAFAELPAVIARFGLEPAANIVLLAAGLFLCLDLAAAAMLREWWVFSLAGAARLAVLGVEAGVVGWLTTPRAENLTTAMTACGTGWPLAPRLPVEPILATAWLLSLAVALVALLRRKTPLEAGLVCALVAVGGALADRGSLRLFVAAAGLSLIVALVENAFKLAFEDGLTGLPARRALEERLQQLGRTYALAMLDLDHFKKLNDRHGHEVGDQVLRRVAARLARTRGGEAFRYGGEEFTVVFAGTSAKQAAISLEALRQEIASRPFTVRSPGRPAKKPAKPLPRPKSIEKNLKVTVSIGVADRSEGCSTPQQVMKAADKALYRAKKAGRNRVTVA